MQQLLGVVHWSLEQVFEVFILWHVLIPSLPPLSYSLTVTDYRLHTLPPLSYSLTVTDYSVFLTQSCGSRVSRVLISKQTSSSLSLGLQSDMRSDLLVLVHSVSEADECLYLSMVNEDLEEGVHQKDSVWQDAAAVQQDGLKHTITLINLSD